MSRWNRIRQGDDVRIAHKVVGAGLRRPQSGGIGRERTTGPHSVRFLTCECGWEVAGPASDLNEHEVDVYYREHIGMRVGQ